MAMAQAATRVTDRAAQANLYEDLTAAVAALTP